MLKEVQKNKYPFSDFDLLGMLDLLEKGIMQILEPKKPKEVGRTSNSKCYQYHRIVNHPLQKCGTLKRPYHIAYQK